MSKRPFVRRLAAGAAVPELPYGAAFALMATEEQQIAELFSEIGPVIAIGKPGERLPELGAARRYVPHDQWQDKVSELMAQSRLVLYRASDTQGFHWEVEHGGQRLPPEKIVFLIPAQSNYRLFCHAAERLLPARFPEEPRKQRRCGSLAGRLSATLHSWLTVMGPCQCSHLAPRDEFTRGSRGLA